MHASRDLSQRPRSTMEDGQNRALPALDARGEGSEEGSDPGEARHAQINYQLIQDDLQEEAALSKDYEGKPEKVAKIIQHCEDNKLWSWDPALPNDPDEKLYLVPGERYIDFRTEGFQQVEGEGSFEADGEMVGELMGEGGALSANACLLDVATLACGNRDSTAALADQVALSPAPPALAPETAANKKKDKEKAKENPTADQVEEDSPKQIAQDKLAAILKESGEAGGWAVSLEPYNLSSDLVAQMKTHCKYLKKLYKELQTKVIADENTWLDYKELLDKVDTAQTWYSGRVKIARAMLAQCQGKKPKPKAKAKASAEPTEAK